MALRIAVVADPVSRFLPDKDTTFVLMLEAQRRGHQVFAIEHRSHNSAILINQVLASPIDGGIGRILLRTGGARPNNIEAVGPHANVRLGVADNRVDWEGVTSGIRHRVTLSLLADKTAWIWCVEATNAGEVAVPIDAILVQDLGLGARVFVTNNEAYASQYIDHHIARHARCGPIVMRRQNLAQDGTQPEHIGALVDAPHLAARLLRRHVGRACRAGSRSA